MLTLFAILDDFNVVSANLIAMSQSEQDPSTELAALEAKLDTLIAQFAQIKNKTAQKNHLRPRPRRGHDCPLKSHGTRLMSRPTQAVSLNILGKEYKIACAPEEQASLINTAEELDKQMRKIRDTGKVAGADRIAVLAALNLASNIKGASSDSDICSRLIDLRQKIENVLENP